MSGLIGLGLIVLASLVHATMQLGTGTLLLLYHASRNKHIKSKTRNLVGSFISGIGIIVFLGVSAACFILTRIFTDDLSKVLFIITVGILVALAIIIWFFYYSFHPLSICHKIWRSVSLIKLHSCFYFFCKSD